jgi:phosphoserine phosphatase
MIDSRHISDFSYIDNIIQNGATHALIDVDNTIAKANITELYLWMKRKKCKTTLHWYLWCVYFAICWGPLYMLLDFIDRDLFQRAFYRRYDQFTMQEVEGNAKELFQKKYKKKFIAHTHDLIFYLKEKNISITLLSTNMDCVVKEYADYFQVSYICLQVKEMHNGRVQVNLEPLRDFKYRAAASFCAQSTIAVADSKHDLPVLNYVKFPLIVSNKRKSWMSGLKKELILLPQEIKDKRED